MTSHDRHDEATTLPPDPTSGEPTAAPVRRPLRWRHGQIALRALAGVFWITAIALVAWGAATVYDEYRSSKLQQDYFSDKASRIAYHVESGEASAPLKPDQGPTDLRLGYAHLGEYIESMKKHGFEVRAQARPSEDMRDVVAQGFYPPYPEKFQAGMSLLDYRGEPIAEPTLSPVSVYADYDAIPQLAIDSLLFLESREMLNAQRPASYNYVVEWDRTINALAEWGVDKVGVTQDVSGGSTLATQLEKFRHTPKGMTKGIENKFVQLYSASLRLYELSNEGDTHTGRKYVILSYINNFPLAAREDMGEVFGLRDGLWAWFGLDPDRVDRALNQETIDAEKAMALRHTVALFMALRRPTELLVRDREQLEGMIDGVLGEMYKKKVIPYELYERAKSQRLRPVRPVEKEVTTPEEFVHKKGVDSVRAELASTLGLKTHYDLERLDMQAASTLSRPHQEKIEQLLVRQMRDPVFLAENGFLDDDSALEKGDPANVDYSFILVEHEDGVNKVRVEVDTIEKPFNLNRGARLDLGSTAKLRTLLTYLSLVVDLYDQWKDKSRRELAAIEILPRDNIAQWVVRELWKDRDITLDEILESALERRYPAYPASFITGGGMQRFSNFSDRYDGFNPPIAYAAQKSINLPFVRLMRDLVWHYQWNKVGPEIIRDKNHPKRREYLMRWIRQDGAKYFASFWSAYAEAEGEKQVLNKLLERHQEDLTPSDYVAMLRWLKPQASLAEIRAYIDDNLIKWRRPILKKIDEDDWERFYRQSAPDKYDLNGRGYVTEIHPMELWIADLRMHHPEVGRESAKKQVNEELDVFYSWLLERDSKRSQNNKIYTMLEEDAFEPIKAHWQRMGWPFDDMIPSLSTALGASADRPEAIAKMMGILARDGKSYPVRRVDAVNIGVDTPYEVRLKQGPLEPTQAIRPEVARAARNAIKQVVRAGTAVRIKELTEQPLFAELAGKTGTGDHKKKSTTRYRTVVGEAVSRTGVFAFTYDDRYFGIMTVYVDGKQAADYEFTSAMAASVFKQMAPVLSDLASQKRVDKLAFDPTREHHYADEAIRQERHGPAPILDELMRPVIAKILNRDPGPRPPAPDAPSEAAMMVRQDEAETP